MARRQCVNLTLLTSAGRKKERKKKREKKKQKETNATYIRANFHITFSNKRNKLRHFKKQQINK
jgi:hypothetical protein